MDGSWWALSKYEYEAYPKQAVRAEYCHPKGDVDPQAGWHCLT